MQKSELTHETLVKLLEYKDDGKLYWKERTSKFGRNFIGLEAGSIYLSGKDKRKYRYVVIFGECYAVHRVIWFYHYGVWPSKLIDHKDGNGLNNKISNLRQATQEENFYNAKMSKNNTTGFKGVSFDKRMKKFKAQICINRRNVTIGHYKTAHEASVAYNTQAKELHKEFYRFT